MADTFWKDYITESLAPGFLQGPNGRAFLEALGEEKDELKSQWLDAVKLRYPSKADPSSYPLHMQRRGLDIMPGETNDQILSRILDAFNLWEWSGTDRGVLTALGTAGVPVNLDTLPGGVWPTDWKPSGCAWIIDNSEWDPADTTHWAKFYILICSVPITADPYAWSALYSPFWIQQIRKWKDAQATCPSVFVITNPVGWADIWAPTGFWDDDDEGNWSDDADAYPIGKIDIGEG